MNLQARVHRRLHRHRSCGTGHAGLGRHALPSATPTTERSAPAALSASPPTSPERLLGYLQADEAAPEPWSPRSSDWAGLQAAAQALMHNGEPLRLGVRAGALPERVRWFGRQLALWPVAERERWLAEQLTAAQCHPLAASPLHDDLDPRLFDTLLSPERRLRLQALWLAIIAPGAVSLDAERRERESSEARALMQGWLERTETV
jgi:hypothetical protein